MNLSENRWRLAAVSVAAFACLMSPGQAAQGQQLSSADPAKVAEVEAGSRQVANAAWWGFDAADSTKAIQAAIDSGAREVVIPNLGQDWIVTPLQLRSNLTLTLEEGVRLMAKKGEFKGRNDSVLNGRNVENVRLVGYGATIQMRKEDYRADPYQEAEWRNCVAFWSSRNVEILGLTLRDSGGDGIYLGSARNARNPDIPPYNENVVIRDVVCDNNYRQGLSVITARNLLVENCTFSNTSGTAPAAGVDLEPNKPGEELTNVVIRNCLFIDNENLGMHVWLGHISDEAPPLDVVWEGNYVRGSNAGIHVSNIKAGRGRIVYRNNIIEGSKHAGIILRRKAADTIDLVFENNLLFNTGTEPADSWWLPAAPIVFHAERNVPARQGGVVFINTHIVHEKADRPMVRFTTIEGFEGWDDITGTISMSVGHGRKAETKIEGSRGEKFDLKFLPSSERSAERR